MDNETYKILFDLVPIGLFLISDKKKIIAWNQWMVDKTNISVNEALNQTLPELFPEHNYSRFDWALDQVLDFRNPQVLSQSLNSFLIPIEIVEGPYQYLEYMQQHTELHPLNINEHISALVIISDVSNSFHQKQDLLSLAKELNNDSVKDSLTGIYNRRYLWDWLNFSIQKNQHSSTQIMCCIADIDNFKHINDRYGHDFGDTAILEFVKKVSASLRQKDVIIRFGGDEFIILSVIEDGKASITKLPERIVSCVREISIQTAQGDLFGLTTSCGVSIWNSQTNHVNADELVNQADAALYMAKDSGKNCYKIYVNNTLTD